MGSMSKELWQPIETAPKDGRWLLMTWADTPHRLESMCWCASESTWEWYEGDTIRVGRWPTHWMPLPEAPE